MTWVVLGLVGGRGAPRATGQVPTAEGLPLLLLHLQISLTPNPSSFSYTETTYPVKCLLNYLREAPL